MKMRNSEQYLTVSQQYCKTIIPWFVREMRITSKTTCYYSFWPRFDLSLPSTAHARRPNFHQDRLGNIRANRLCEEWNRCSHCNDTTSVGRLQFHPHVLKRWEEEVRRLFFFCSVAQKNFHSQCKANFHRESLYVERHCACVYVPVPAGRAPIQLAPSLSAPTACSQPFASQCRLLCHQVCAWLE